MVAIRALRRMRVAQRYVSNLEDIVVDIGTFKLPKRLRSQQMQGRLSAQLRL